MVKGHVCSFDFSASTCQNNSQQQHKTNQRNWIHCLILFFKTFISVRLWSLCCPRTSQPQLLLCWVPACSTCCNRLEWTISAILGEILIFPPTLLPHYPFESFLLVFSLSLSLSLSQFIALRHSKRDLRTIKKQAFFKNKC